MHPMELWHLALLATNHAIMWPQLVQAWQRKYPLADELGLRPQRRYSSRGETRRLKLPLVTPRALPDGESAGTVLRRLVDLARQSPATFVATALVEDVLGVSVDSLLLRLSIRSLQVAFGNLGRDKLGVQRRTLEPIAIRTGVSPRLSEWIGAVDPEDLDEDSDRARAVRRVIEALQTLGGVPAADLERLLPAAIDCATHRIDPWVAAFARRRLRRMSDQPPRLGAYGWVDRPRAGQPGPTAGGLLTAPSLPQALTAALIRDRALSDPEPTRWHMDVTSDRVRRAARLADEVRRGAHPAEALGREVERVVANPLQIRELRRRFPLRREHAGRRTCDGLRVLGADPDSLDFLPPPVLAELAQLRDSIDVYGDLLVAEAVHHVVEGRTGSAGAALDAAAGLARPPVLDVLQTRREGRPAQTSCLLVLRDVAAPGLPADPATASPARLADAAVARFLAARIGAADEWRWQLTTSTNGDRTDVDLTDLGLEPADALALPLGVLERLVVSTVARPGRGAHRPGRQPAVRAGGSAGRPARQGARRRRRRGGDQHDSAGDDQRRTADPNRRPARGRPGAWPTGCRRSPAPTTAGPRCGWPPAGVSRPNRTQRCPTRWWARSRQPDSTSSSGWPPHPSTARSADSTRCRSAARSPHWLRRPARSRCSAGSAATSCPTCRRPSRAATAVWTAPGWLRSRRYGRRWPGSRCSSSSPRPRPAVGRR